MRERLIQEIGLYRRLKGAKDPEGSGSSKPSQKLDFFGRQQDLLCEIKEPIIGGYEVLVKRGNLRGLLPTSAKLKIGHLISARFVCIHQNAVVVTDALSDATICASPQPELESDPISVAVSPLPMDQNERLDIARRLVSQFRCKRAVDLIPMLGGEKGTTHLAVTYPSERLFCDLESQKFTGAVLVLNQQLLTRSAIVLYEGRLIGCIYGSKFSPLTKSTARSFALLCSDSAEPQTIFSIYDQPKDVIFAFGALFMGYPVEPQDNVDASDYLEASYAEMKEKSVSGCLAITLPGTVSTCLFGVRDGEFIGARWVEDEVLTHDLSAIRAAMKDDPNATVQLSVFSAEQNAKGDKLGWLLSE